MEHKSSAVDGVVVKEIARHKDERGYFAELMKKGEPGFHRIEQTSYSLSLPGVIKAFHFHDYFETWVVLQGEAQLVIHDTRPDSSTFGATQVIYAGESHPLVVTIPPKVAHGYRVLGERSVGMLYHAEEAYDPGRKDQIGNIPHNSPEIGFDWNMTP